MGSGKRHRQARIGIGNAGGKDDRASGIVVSSRTPTICGTRRRWLWRDASSVLAFRVKAYDPVAMPRAAEALPGVKMVSDEYELAEGCDAIAFDHRLAHSGGLTWSV